MKYVKESDRFSVMITDGANITLGENSENAEGSEGRLYLSLEGDTVDNQTLSHSGTYSVVVTLLYAGDQYPYYLRSEGLRVEDTANDYLWSVEYTFVDRNL